MILTHAQIAIGGRIDCFDCICCLIYRKDRLKRMIRADISDLNIVEWEHFDVEIDHYIRMGFAESILIFILDHGRLVGIISEGDLKKGKNPRECINKLPIVIKEQGGVEEIVQHMLWHSSIDFVPIINADNKLLCVYFQGNLLRIQPYDIQNTEAIIFNEYQKVKREYKDKDVFVLTDLKFSNTGLQESIISIEELKNLDVEKCLLYLAFAEADSYMKVMPYVKKYSLPYVGCGAGCFRARKYSMEDSGGVVDYISINAAARNVLKKEYIKGGKYFCMPDMENICQVIESTRNVPGSYVEIGVFRGDTARVALHYMKETGINRECWLVDTFCGFTYDEAESSSDVHWNGTHTTTSVALVKERLNEYQSVHFLEQNIIIDDLPNEIGDVAVCNIDVDMEEAVYSALNKMKNRISPGGIIIAEDYGHMPTLTGAFYSVNRFIKESGDKFTCLYMPSGQMLLIRK
mgnify:CR=1 FL=1